MPRCPTCARFVSVDLGEPEVEIISIEDNALVAEVRVAKCCTECGEELEEARVDMMDEDVELCHHIFSMEPEEISCEAEILDNPEKTCRVTLHYKVVCDVCPFERNGVVEADISFTDFESLV